MCNSSIKFSKCNFNKKKKKKQYNKLTITKSYTMYNLTLIIYIYIEIFLYKMQYSKCKVTIWFLNPKGKRIQAQRAQYNEFVESELENQALMSWVTIIMNQDDKKVKIDWFYLKKIVNGTIRGDQFLYISLEFEYRHSSCYYSVFLSIL